MQGYLGPEARLHSLWALLLSQHHSQSTLRFFGDGRGTSSFRQPHPQAGQCPCLPRQHAQLLAAETQDPIDSMPVFYDITWRRGRGARGDSLRGLSKPLMIWEVPDAKLRGYLASMCSAWIPHSSTDPRAVPLSAQVDAQLMGRSSQKAERGTKVETAAEGVSPRCPLSALSSLYKTLGKDAALPVSSCPDRAQLRGASSEKGRQTGRDAVLGIL